MITIEHSILIFLTLILLSCNIKSAETTRAELKNGIPEGAVPFEYDFKMKKAIFIPGTLNDSIPLRYLFDTGFKKMTFSDSLASDLEKKDDNKQFHKVQKTMKVRIGRWEQAYGGSVDACYLDRKNLIFGFLGSNVAIIPWRFFDKKIIEISFSKQYIRELYGTKDLTEYDSVKMELANSMLVIPVVVTVQGEKIREFVAIDTGNNGDISFSNNIVSKYSLKSESAYFGENICVDGFRKGFSITSDTIQVGKYSLTGKNYISFSLDKHWPFSVSGLLGTGILDKFDMVFDLKNFNLYLKPINK